MDEARKKFWTTIYGKKFRDQCNCLDACTFIKYRAKIEGIKLALSLDYDGVDTGEK